MAAVSSLIMSGATLASAGAGVYKTVSGNRQMREAQDKIEHYERQTLSNTLAGIDVPYQTYNMQTEQVQQMAANAADSAAQAGARGLAFLPSIQNNEFEQQQQINARLEENLYQLSLEQAREEQRIQQMTERREEAELAGYGALYEAGRQTKYSGIGDTIKSTIGFGGVLGQMGTNPTNNGIIQPVTQASRNYVDKQMNSSVINTGDTSLNPYLY